MKKVFYILFVCVLLFFSVTIINKYFGWYAYKKYDLRRYSNNIEESKKRGVFIEELKFEVEPDSLNIIGQDFFIEKGYKWGKHSSKKTITLESAKYPYQISFNIKNSIYHLNLINNTSCDSCDLNACFLKEPYLKDTLIIKVFRQKGTKIINFENVGRIKVW